MLWQFIFNIFWLLRFQDFAVGDTRLKIEFDSIFDIIKQRGSTDRKLDNIKGVSETKTNNKEGKANFEMERGSKI